MNTVHNTLISTTYVVDNCPVEESVPMSSSVTLINNPGIDLIDQVHINGAVVTYIPRFMYHNCAPG